ncbi:MAG TPA: preprotein translocase subunit SecA, partial [Patescibacteria group bacterium]|nr:preprotein translocase subunit SecA [Patescibacteria group bacterium]
MLKFFSKFIDTNDKAVEEIQPLAGEVNSLEEKVSHLKKTDFPKKTAELKAVVQAGTRSLDEVLPEAFALVRGAAERTIKQRHFDVQLIGGAVLHQGKIAEMKTGEGKTLVATLPSYLNALTGKGVHVVTVNDYLARRDGEWMGQIYHYLGLSVGVVNHEKSYLFDEKGANPTVLEEDIEHPEEFGTGKFLREVTRKEAYAADITYGTNNEFGFDYLRDNMVLDLEQKVQRGHHYAIVDEVDSILIDEARTPLIISAPGQEPTEKYYQFAKVVDSLEEGDFQVDEKLKTANLTEKGISHIEKILGIENLYEKDFKTIHHIEEALKAKTLFRRDRDYVVREGEVVIVDEFTGRMMFGRRYSEGLHQAIEAKEGVKIQQESQTMATISFQNYFRMYDKLAGMTGTASTEAEEFHKIYQLEVVAIPTNRPNIRLDHPDLVFKSLTGKFNAIAQDIAESHKKGQPVLVGTTSIEKNEYLGGLLKKLGVPHEILNAKNHEKEAHIVARAGEVGAVTVATNMAGRGVDIKLGKGAVEKGGLYVIGTERHEARRIDNQLRGRSGRQGDPGATRFYLSLEDDIMRLFGGEAVSRVMTTFKLPEDMPIESGMVSKAIESAQTRVEGHNFDIRKQLVDYDDVMNKQREIIYGRRDELLRQSKDNPRGLRDLIIGNIKKEIENFVRLQETEHGELNYDGIVQELQTIIPFDEASQKNLLAQIKSQSSNEIISKLQDLAENLYETREKSLGEETVRQIERFVYLNVLDSLWVEHLDTIDDLRQGIG